MLATISPSASDSLPDQESGGMVEDGMIGGGFFGLNFDTNRCKPNTSFIWCLPSDYNQEKHPFTCGLHFITIAQQKIPVAVHHLQNKSLPWDYDFRFVIEEISNINDKEQASDVFVAEKNNN